MFNFAINGILFRVMPLGGMCQPQYGPGLLACQSRMCKIIPKGRGCVVMGLTSKCSSPFAHLQIGCFCGLDCVHGPVDNVYVLSEY